MTTPATSELDVLLRVYAELSYRSNRIQAHLDNIKTTESEKEYLQLVDTIEVALNKIRHSLPSIRTALSTLGALPSDVLHNLIFQDLVRFSEWYTFIHDLLIFLPSRSVLPETVDVLSASFADHYETIHPSVILGSLFNALEYDFYENVKYYLPDISEIVSGSNIVLQLPLCDRYSPSGWVVLAHEMGHAIDSENNISESVLQSKVKPGTNLYKLTLPWTREKCADIIAAEILGPASILGLISIEYCLYPQLGITSPTKSKHPPTLWRIEYISSYCEEKHKNDFLKDERLFYDVAWDMRLKRTEISKDEKNKLENEYNAFFQYFEQVTESLGPAVKNIINNNHYIENDSVKRCINRLDMKRAISAQGLPRSKLQEEVGLFRKRNFETDLFRIDEFKKLKTKFTEQFLDISTMLLACFARRHDIMNGAISEGIQLLSDEEKTAQLCNRLLDVDDLVVNSIGSSMVHRRIIEN